MLHDVPDLNEYIIAKCNHALFSTFLQVSQLCNKTSMSLNNPREISFLPGPAIKMF